MKLSQDRQQKLLVALFISLDIYRIIVGCFYSIFVPQLCTDRLTKAENACTLKDNITDLTDYNTAVIAVNALTAASMLAAFIIELRRELWMIKHLEVDSKKADDNLVHEIESYDNMKQSFLKKNRHYTIVFSVAGSLAIINAIMSGVLMGQYFDGLKTVTTFATNSLLIGMRSAKSLQIARKCTKDMKALSAYLGEQTAYNTIDPDYRIVPKITDNNAESKI
jgi:hypothetical protein